ncbi:MAG TPA: DegT/DnrJ/EryC1/StrS family aminotransferase [Dehalococcoidia bacterium]|nr:DegT/DnrJ/EryC1/StrS family aminotransferase [Dehalococcoidia bacterium]
MSIPLVDLKAQYMSIKDEIDNAIRNVIESTQFVLGSQVAALEAEIAAYCETRYAVGVASGTDALRLALLACGVRPDDEVITTPFTFIATAEAITQCGATPVFADIDPRTYNIEPTKLEAKITKKTRALLPVHLYGQPADMSLVLELAQKYNLKVIEDCAQALGSKYQGRKVGSLGNAGCLSFFPSKVLGGYGDGGMVVTNDAEVAQRVALLRNHGTQGKYHHVAPGFNSRLDELQAAVLRVKLHHLDRWVAQRQQKAQLYSRLLHHIRGIESPHIAPGCNHIFNYYTVRLVDSRARSALQEYLAAQGIATAIYYPLSLHLQDVYKPLGGKPGDFPESEQAQETVLSLPIYPELGDKEIERICEAIKDFCVGQLRS